MFGARERAGDEERRLEAAAGVERKHVLVRERADALERRGGERGGGQEEVQLAANERQKRAVLGRHLRVGVPQQTQSVAVVRLGCQLDIRLVLRVKSEW